MQEFTIKELLKTHQAGPLANILRYLNSKDLKKLSFVFSSSREEMRNRYQSYKELCSLGRKIETVIFDSRYVSFEPTYIQTIIKFIDSVQGPWNHLTKEQTTFLTNLEKTRDLNFNLKKVANNLYNLRFGIKLGEKVKQDLLAALVIDQKYRFISIVKIMVKKYKNSNYVLSMMPKKAIGVVMGNEKHYIFIFKLYKLFGIDYIKELISNLDSELFFKNLFSAMKSYIYRVANFDDAYQNYRSTFHYDKKQLEKIIRIGCKLIGFIRNLVKEYHYIDDKYFAHHLIECIQDGQQDLEDIIKDYESNVIPVNQ